MSMHVSAFACKAVRAPVRDWESAQREGRTVSKRRIRKDNRERVRWQGEIKQRVCLNTKKKKSLLDVMKDEECDCG